MKIDIDVDDINNVWICKICGHLFYDDSLSYVIKDKCKLCKEIKSNEEKKE